MENANPKESFEWVAKQLACLDPPVEFEFDSAAALRRFHMRTEAVASRQLWRRWPTWVAATVLIAAIVLLLPRGRIAAQQLWQFLTVRQVAFLRVGSWPEGVPSPQVKIIGIVIPPIPARDTAEVQGRVRYDPRLPRHGVLSGTPRLSTTFSMAAGTLIKTADLELALQKANITDQPVPRQWDGAHLALHTSAIVLAEWPDIVLAQSLPLTLTAPSGFDFAAFSTVMLRIIGVGPEEARRLAMQMGTVPPWLAPLDRRDFDQRATMEEIVLNSGPATLVQEKGSNGTVKRTTIFWSVPDRVYLLSGTLSREWTVLTANSVQ